jgi:flagellar biosynthesis/type III secretory pathway protein FliH
MADETEDRYDEGYDAGYDDGEASARRDADAAHQEGYDEGYADGQQEAESAGLEALKAVNKWLEERGLLNWEDYPEGLSTNDMMELIYQHEEDIALAANAEICAAVN